MAGFVSLSALASLEFIVLTATDAWWDVWTDQVAFGPRSVMRWYLTALLSIDSLPNVNFYPESILAQVMEYQASRSLTGALLVYAPRSFVHCICRADPCDGDCTLVPAWDGALSAYSVGWRGISPSPIAAALCPRSELHVLQLAYMKNVTD